MVSRAIVAGGGVGGIPAAIALCKAGFEVKVFEQSQELREVGAGLTLHANSLAALNHIDPALLKTVKKHALEPDLLRITDHRGKIFSALKKHQLIDRYGYPTVIVHRGELLHSFTDFAKSMRSSPEIVTGSQVVDIQFDPNDKTVTVILADGAQEKAGLVIGADGLRSIIREKIHGVDNPRYLGYVAWRGITHDYPTEKVSTCASFGRGASVGLFPIIGDRVYWWFTENVLEKDLEEFEKSMTQEMSPEECQSRIISVLQKKRWFPESMDVIGKCDSKSIIFNPIFDRLPLPTPWGWDCVTLLGDAAHPTSPILGQGACQAIEDSACLYTVLSSLPDTPSKSDIAEALRRYEEIRVPPSKTVTEASNFSGRMLLTDNSIVNLLTFIGSRMTPTGVMLKQMDSYMKPHF